MNTWNAMLAGLGSSAIVLGLTASALAQHPHTTPLWPMPSDPPLPSSTSSLGGPITPTQPNFFTNDSATPMAPDLAVTSAKTLGLQPLRYSNRPAAPFVDDPPRPGGGFINVKTD